MSNEATPYFSECPMCGDGLLRFWRRVRTGDLALLCDECDAIWEDIPALAGDPTRKPSHLFPDWPGDNRYRWEPADRADLKHANLIKYMQGESV